MLELHRVHNQAIPGVAYVPKKSEPDVLICQLLFLAAELLGPTKGNLLMVKRLYIAYTP